MHFCYIGQWRADRKVEGGRERERMGSGHVPCQTGSPWAVLYILCMSWAMDSVPQLQPDLLSLFYKVASCQQDSNLW